MPDATTDTTLVWAKPWLTSRLMWTSIAGTALSLLVIFRDAVAETAGISLPETWGAYLALAIAVITGILRMDTKQPITASTKPKATVVETNQPKPGLE